jgi:uncharacterized protein with NRDE domain
LCLIVVAWRAREDLELVVTANRDEWRDRPAKIRGSSGHQCAGSAGRDLKAGGTWMGVTRDGRFAAVTNFRDPSDKRSTATSRGRLATDFLLGTESALRFLSNLSARAKDYNAFNLILGDGASLFYYGSREGTPRPIEPGVHGLSNHVLDEPWPKVVRGSVAMELALRESDLAEPLFRMLSDREPAPDEELPHTGVGVAWERRLSPPLITGADYGTRASTVMTMAASGEVNFEERTRSETGEVTATARERFAVSQSTPPVMA